MQIKPPGHGGVSPTLPVPEHHMGQHGTAHTMSFYSPQASFTSWPRGGMQWEVQEFGRTSHGIGN